MPLNPEGLEAIIFDWAGTTVDFGSLAPIQAFQTLFANQGLPISQQEARGPMGTEKREHITQLLQMPRIAEAWEDRFGSKASEQDIDRLYDEFLPLQLSSIVETAELIPGMLETIDFLRSKHIAIGANTGYNREMLGTLAPVAAKLGYTPDSSVSAEDTPIARPAPSMSLLNAIELKASAVYKCIKVDDTVMGVEEGCNAGMWSVGVSISGNETGLSLSDWQALGSDEQQAYREQAEKRLSAAGAHFVIDSVAELPAVVEKIEQALAAGKRP